jgi:thiol-disulfide isomerase/thioredoxin
MRFKTVVAVGLLMMILPMMIAAGTGSGAEQNMPFPSYGSGPVEARLSTDYFCPPCRAMEPEVEPLLKDVLKENAITLTLVDVPFHQYTPLYAKNFLYALKENNALEHAFRVRNFLNNVPPCGTDRDSGTDFAVFLDRTANNGTRNAQQQRPPCMERGNKRKSEVVESNLNRLYLCRL